MRAVHFSWPKTIKNFEIATFHNKMYNKFFLEIHQLATGLNSFGFLNSVPKKEQGNITIDF